jgi:cyclase
VSVQSLSASTKAFVQTPGGWFLNNAGWVTGTDRTLLVDTCATEGRSRRLLDAVRDDTSGQPVTAALTHAHGDHANGAGMVVREGGTVMATPLAAATIHAGPHTFEAVFECSTWGDITPPTISDTVTEPVELDLGGVVAQVLPVAGRAHTDGDLVVVVPRDGIVFSGDLVFAGVTPLALSGSVIGWLAALDWLAGIDHAHLVPGHGPVLPANSTEVAAMTDYLRWLLDTVSADGVDLAVAEKRALERWSHWSEGERHGVNLLVAAAEVHGTQASLPELAVRLLTSAGGRIPLDI